VEKKTAEIMIAIPSFPEDIVISARISPNGRGTDEKFRHPVVIDIRFELSKGV